MVWSEEDDNRVRELCKTINVGKLTQCPKCSMGEGGVSELMLTHFCTHKYCPFREWSKAKKEAEKLIVPYDAALNTWKNNGGPRPTNRPDGIPTRIDHNWHTDAEIAIVKAMVAVESAGASVALTDAITLLAQARARVADHVEGIK